MIREVRNEVRVSIARFVTFTVEKCACIGVVVSDDGMVDIVPEYRPKISRRKLEESIEKLTAAFNGDDFDEPEFNQNMEWLRDHCFYLSSQQCRSINDLNEKYRSRPMGSGFRPVYSELEPDSEMDDSFFEE